MDIENAKRIFEEPEPFIAEQWLRFLGDEQMEIEDNILESVKSAESFQFHMVLGGAGTGKTQVLLLLAEELQESGFKVGYFTTPHVRNMISKAGLDMPKETSTKGAVHLVDDPEEVGQVIEAFRRAEDLKARALVVAIDPFQWTERTAFLKLATILGDHDPAHDLLGKRNTLITLSEEFSGITVKRHYLKTAYRQTKVAGAGSVDLSQSIFQRMNPYVANEKMHQFASISKPFVQNLLSGLDHVAEGGAFHVLEDGSVRDIWLKIASLVARKDRWTWTQSMLFVFDSVQASSKWSDFRIDIPGVSDQRGFDNDATMSQVLQSLNARQVNFANPTEVRGQEFQDVVVCLSKSRWKQFKTAKVGMGGPEWKAIMPMHTFMTRAIDSVNIIVA